MKEQASGISEINLAVDGVDHITWQNAAMVEESSAAPESLPENMATLAGLMVKLRVESQASRQQTARATHKSA